MHALRAILSNTMSTVGIIANPAAGKDIRRLVAQGRVVSNQEKSNILRRVFAGLQSQGIANVLIMPDMAGLAINAMNDTRDGMNSQFVEQTVTGHQSDSTAAASMMRDAGARCIVTLGGDGTNRLVAKGCGDVPLAPISTGTNNVFPREIEGTLAGIAAATVATRRANRDQVCRRSKKINGLRRRRFARHRAGRRRRFASDDGRRSCSVGRRHPRLGVFSPALKRLA